VINGKTYTVVNVSGYGVLIKRNGQVHNKALNGQIVMLLRFKTTPTNLSFEPISTKKIKTGAGYLNYELIYSGRAGGSITLLYREYSSADLARPAFYQNLVYESDQKQIRFKDNIFSIHEATNEKIVYTVISDGLSK